MSLPQAIALGIPGAVFGWLLAHIAFAPAGYEDAAGFHLGSPTTDDRQHGEGKRVRGEIFNHNGVIADAAR